MKQGLTFNVALVALLSIVRLSSASPGDPADSSKRTGDEIVIGGQYFHSGTDVVLWTDPGGKDLSSYQRRPVTRPATGPMNVLPAGELITSATQPSTEPYRTIRGPDVPLADLQKSIDQFVIHFDACGTSQECFRVLKKRGLAVQFMLDLDGTIYQAMDCSQAAAHATIANSRSVGIEIANIGGYTLPSAIPQLHRNWYRKDHGVTRITLPVDMGDGGVRTPHFVGHPSRPDPVQGFVQGKEQRQYDYTPQQYRALAKLTATLCTVLPEIRPDFPRQRSSMGPPKPEPTTQPIEGDPTTRPSVLAALGEPGTLIPHMLTPDQYDAYHGVLGHYHVQFNKDDPGPAFQWVPLMNEVRRLMKPEALKAAK